MTDRRITFGCLPLLVGVLCLALSQVVNSEVLQTLGWLAFAGGALVLALSQTVRRER